MSSRVALALSGVRTVLRNENLRRVEGAWGAAIGAEWAHFVALGVFAYQAGGAAAVGVAGLVRMLPAAFVAPFAASLGDRFRRERLLVAVALLGCCALAGSAVAYFTGASRFVIFALAAFVGIASTLVRPAHQALLPSLARTPEELIACNGATSTIESLGTLVGPLVAGLLVSVANVGVVFAVSAAAFALAAVLLGRVRVEGRLQTAGGSGRRARNFVAGLELVARERRPRLVVGLIAAQTFVRGCLNVLIVVAAFRLHGDASAVGYMTAAIGAGGLVGAFAALTLEGRRLAAPFGAALVFWGAPIALIAPLPYLVSALFLLAVVGAANSIEDVAGFTLLQRIVPDKVLSGALGVTWGLAMGSLAVGSIVAPAVVAALGARAAFVVVGAILPLLTLVTWRRLAEIDRTALPPTTELALVDGVPLFAPLSCAAKERLAAALVRVPAAAGESVVRTGDVGDRFYIVRDGRLDIVGEGFHTSASGGDYFGEIALMREVPRTATVRAVVDSQLYALERADFLAAVSGHAGVRAAADEVVDRRLSAPGRT